MRATARGHLRQDAVDTLLHRWMTTTMIVADLLVDTARAVMMATAAGHHPHEATMTTHMTATTAVLHQGLAAATDLLHRADILMILMMHDRHRLDVATSLTLI